MTTKVRQTTICTHINNYWSKTAGHRAIDIKCLGDISIRFWRSINTCILNHISILDSLELCRIPICAFDKAALREGFEYCCIYWSHRGQPNTNAPKNNMHTEESALPTTTPICFDNQTSLQIIFNYSLRLLLVPLSLKTMLWLRLLPGYTNH